MDVRSAGHVIDVVLLHPGYGTQHDGGFEHDVGVGEENDLA